MDRQVAGGSLQGQALDATGSPLADVAVLIHAADGSTDRGLLSGDDGSFVVRDLKPGAYRLTVSKEGFG